MKRTISATVALLMLAGCASVPYTDREAALQFHNNGSLITNCKRLGPISSDSRGHIFNFDEVADHALAADAIARYGDQVDGLIIVNRYAYPLGRIVLKGIALQCLPK